MGKKRHKKREDKSWIWLCSLLAIFFIFIIICYGKGSLKANGSFQKTISSIAQSIKLTKYSPPTLKSLIVHPDSTDNYFDFILDTQDEQAKLTDLTRLEKGELEDLAKQLIDYFFLGITLPSEDLWVNLNSVRQNEITSPRLALTDIGKVLLEADLRLKKDCCRFTDPRTKTGKEYWNKLQARLNEEGLSTTQLPIGNRFWIIPLEATVEEDKDNHTVTIVKSRLKVCLQQEYLQLQNNHISLLTAQTGKERLAQDIADFTMKETVLPAMQDEVNYGKAYAKLRQVYDSLILAEYYKQKYQHGEGLYPRLVNRGYIEGLESSEPWNTEDFYNAYVKSAQEGEYHLSQQEYDPYLASMVQKYYFYGGVLIKHIASVLKIGEANYNSVALASSASSNSRFLAKFFRNKEHPNPLVGWISCLDLRHHFPKEAMFALARERAEDRDTTSKEELAHIRRWTRSGHVALPGGRDDSRDKSDTKNSFMLSDGTTCNIVSVDRKFANDNKKLILKLINEVPGSNWDEKKLFEEYAAKWEDSFAVVHENGDIIAILLAYEEGPNDELNVANNHIFVRRVCVDLRFRRQYIATHLLRHLATHITSTGLRYLQPVSGHNYIVLQSDATNIPANAVYQTLNFDNIAQVAVGDHRDNVYVIDAQELVVNAGDKISSISAARAKQEKRDNLERAEIALRSISGHALIDKVMLHIQNIVLKLALIKDQAPTKLDYEPCQRAVEALTAIEQVALAQLGREIALLKDDIITKRHTGELQDINEIIKRLEGISYTLTECQEGEPMTLEHIFSWLDNVEDANLKRLIQAERNAYKEVRDTLQDQIAFMRRQLKAEPCNINALIQETTPIIEKELGMPEHVLKLELASDIPTCFINPRRIRRVIGEIVKNAWEHRNTTEPSIVIRTEWNDPEKQVMVRVIDNGSGILQEKLKDGKIPDRPQIFDLGKERGLGLAEAWVIVTDHPSGTIEVQSELGKGTTFTIRLPIEGGQVFPPVHETGKVETAPKSKDSSLGGVSGIDFREIMPKIKKDE